MDVKNPTVERRGNENNVETEYYCPKWDHSDYEE